jgi:renalase
MKKKIAIIGAGIAGLTIAKKLAIDYHITIFDKSRGIGGRMATRRIEEYHFDHGAQFFTAKTNEFQKFCHKAQKDDIIAPWQCKLVEINDGLIIHNHANKIYPYYVAKPQMNNLCKYLSKDLPVILQTTILALTFKNNKWSVITDNQNSALAIEKLTDFDGVILATPPQQALAILPKNFIGYNLVQKTKMLGCFTLMLGLKKPLKLPFDAAKVKNSIIQWVAVNNSKPQRPNNTALVIHSDNHWAEQNIEENLTIIKDKLIANLQKIILIKPEDIIYQNIHRWRYAATLKKPTEASFFDSKLKLGVCGDWLLGSKVENAFLSATNLATKINF